MYKKVEMEKRACILLVLMILVVGCSSTLEVGIERTPTPDPAAPATIAALRTENARLATRVAIQVTPTPAPLDLGQLAYVQGGDIWVKALPDGKPLRLTTDGRNREPRWAPSGDWLAFRKERATFVQREVPCDIPQPHRGNEVCREAFSLLQKQVWLMQADGSRAHVLDQGSSVEGFSWAPTHDRLAYVSENGDLQTINADGSKAATLVPHNLTNPNPGRVGRMAWSPDGAWIGYEWRIPQSEPSASYQGLWKVSADGKTRVELHASGAPRKGEAILAGWSPRGSTVLFWQSEMRTPSLTDSVALYGVSHLKDSEGFSIVKSITTAMLAYADFIAPAPPGTSWGERDAVAIVVGAGHGTWTNKSIETVKPLTPKDVAAISPAWSPTGTRLAYAAMPTREDLTIGEVTLQDLMQRRLWVVETSGEGHPRRLTNAAAYRDEHPLWSADSTHLLFARLDMRGRASLWLIAVDTGATRQMVDELTPAPDPFGFYGHVDWDGLFDWWRGSGT
jgi:Tol biopolymer transport system component